MPIFNFKRKVIYTEFGYVEASSVDEAFDLLSLPEPEVDFDVLDMSSDGAILECTINGETCEYQDED